MMLRCGNAGPAAWLIRPSVQQGRVPGVCPAGGRWCHLASDWARFSRSSWLWGCILLGCRPSRAPLGRSGCGAWRQRAQGWSQRVGAGPVLARSLGRAVGLGRSPAASRGEGPALHGAPRNKTSPEKAVTVLTCRLSNCYIYITVQSFNSS